MRNGQCTTLELPSGGTALGGRNMSATEAKGTSAAAVKDPAMGLLEGKVALVTGGTSGIGREYLQEYRPILLRSRSEDWLFPGNTPQTLHREQVARREKRAITNSACRSAL